MARAVLSDQENTRGLMTTKEWREEVRPLVEAICAFLLYLRFGGFTTEPTILQCFVAAKIFTTELEKDLKFTDR